MLGLRCCTGFALVAVSGAAVWVWCPGELLTGGSLAPEQTLGCLGFGSCGPQAQELWLWAPEHGLSSLAAHAWLLHGR